MRLNHFLESVLPVTPNAAPKLIPRGTALSLACVLLCLTALSMTAVAATAAQDIPLDKPTAPASPNTNANPASNPTTPPVSTLITVPDQPNQQLSEKISPKKLATPDEKSAEKIAVKLTSAIPVLPPILAPNPTPHIALILPLNSKAFGNVADAIKQGFIAAATVDGKDATPYRVYAHDDEAASLGAQYRKAVQEGAIADQTHKSL